MKIDSAEAIVTGAARGLERYFALALAREGARVVAADSNPAGLRTLESESAGCSPSRQHGYDAGLWGRDAA